TKRRAALFIERDDLSVKDGALGSYELRQAPKFGKLRREVILVARHQTHAPVFNEGDGAVTVPFNFEQPVRIVEGLPGGSSQHRKDDRGHGLLLGAGESFNRRGRGVGKRGVRRRFLAS